ncbi:MAG: hypothetical protein PHX62_03870 [Bacilli bacterium]|nr:hypothetical protein [Bacilli bacterium]
MRTLLKSHLIYLTNKTTIIIFGLILFLSSLAYLDFAYCLENTETTRSNNLYYFENSFFIVKMLTVFTASFIFAYAFLPKNNQYAELLLIRKLSRVSFFLTKVLVLAFFILYFLFLEFSLYIIVGYFFFPKFILTNYSVLAFINLFFLSLYFGLFSLFLYKLFLNLYVIILPFFLFICGIIINENNPKFGEIYNFIFPGFLCEKPELYHGFFHILIMIIVLILINLFIYLTSDIK